MSGKIYYIETNKSWFKRYFKRGMKKYSLCKTYAVKVYDSWCWDERWVVDVIENSDDLDYLETKLKNLKIAYRERGL